MRQLGVALANYAHDNGAYPFLITWTGNDFYDTSSPSLAVFARQFWYGNLMFYCSSPIPPEPDGIFTYETICPPVFRCPGSYIKRGTPGIPTAHVFGIWNGRVMEDYEYRPDKGVGYAYNPRGTGGKGNLGLGSIGGLNKPCEESELQSPSDMIAIGCSYSLWYARYYENATDGIGGWHSDQANVLFADGHIDLVKSNIMVAPTDQSRRRWNRDNQPHPETWLTSP